MSRSCNHVQNTVAITQGELARRLRAARESCQMTQEEVADHLELSRAAISQMEQGRRGVSSLELYRLAHLYGRDIQDFLEEDLSEGETVMALFRRQPGVAMDAGVLDSLRQCITLGREITNLERRLGLDRGLATIPIYPVPAPDSKWDAVQQGGSAAAKERHRLNLGDAPLPDVVDLLESQRIRTAQVNLPDDISGLTLIDARHGILVAVNRRHHVLRRRFSCAHEYAHVLFDREIRGMLSRSSDRANLNEVRANAFAAAFLMPEGAVRSFVYGLAKGRPSRAQMDVYDGEVALHAEGRMEPGSQDIQMHDLVRIAHHFGVSRAAMLYRLKDIRMINETERTTLAAEDQAGRGRAISEILGLPEPDHEAERNRFHSRFLSLGMEALRREEITRNKLRELIQLADPDRNADALLKQAGLDTIQPVDILRGEC